MKKILFILSMVLGIVSVQSANITGTVTDAETGELLVGVTVFVKDNLKHSTSTGLDGTFKLRNVPVGSHTVVFRLISYDTFEQTIHISDHSTQTIDAKLTPQGMELSSVVVTASSNTTDFGARKLEKISPNILNVVSANFIENSPDITVANVLQRVSGVTLERNSSGEGQYAVLRGMDKRYNISLVNGVKIASPDNKQRYIPLDIFPSELLDRLIVGKTRTAEVEGDATGGAINMDMKDAPHQFTLNVNGSLGYNSMFFERDFLSFDHKKLVPVAPYEKFGSDYRATIDDLGNTVSPIYSKKPLPNGIFGISVGNSFFDNRLGVILAANYQNHNKGTNSVLLGQSMSQTDESKAVFITDMNDRTYSENEVRTGLHAKIDFSLNENHKFEFYNAYIYNKASQVRDGKSINYGLYYNPEQGNYDYSFQTRMRIIKQNIYSSTLLGHHKLLPQLSLNWSGIFSLAKNDRPDQTYINLDQLVTNNEGIIFADADGSPRRWEHNTDRDLSGLINLTYLIDSDFGKLTLQGGGLYRNKKRDNFYVSYTIRPLNGRQNKGEDFNTIDEIQWVLSNPQGSVGPLNYKASEDIVSGYAQAKLEIAKWEAILGIRTEYTNQGYFMFFPNADDDPDGKQIYTDFLPNLNIKYAYNDKNNLRASYFRSINRPGFFEIVPYQMKYEDYDEYGNPELKRAIIDNADIRWEFFPTQTEQIMVGIFYKHIKDPIEYAYHTKNYRQYGYMPVNLGNANNLGAEIDIIKYYREFGIKANYTYTNSSIITPKAFYTTDEAGSIMRAYEDQKRPLVGQAAHIANLALLYKSVDYGIDAQIATTYSGEKIAIASFYLNSDIWQKGGFYLDASAEKKFRNGFSVYAKANNLLNTPRIEFIKTHNPKNDGFPLQTAKGNTIIRKEYYKPSFLVGVRFKM